eukprot:COSAG06_NODE_13677_length_1232_cov_1.676081_1_plen_191_part_00
MNSGLIHFTPADPHLAGVPPFVFLSFLLGTTCIGPPDLKAIVRNRAVVLPSTWRRQRCSRGRRQSSRTLSRILYSHALAECLRNLFALAATAMPVAFGSAADCYRCGQAGCGTGSPRILTAQGAELPSPSVVCSTASPGLAPASCICGSHPAVAADTAAAAQAGDALDQDIAACTWLLLQVIDKGHFVII